MEKSSTEEEVFEAEPLQSLAPMFPTPLGFNIACQSTTPPFILLTPTGPLRSDPTEPGQPAVPPGFRTRVPETPREKREKRAEPIDATPISSALDITRNSSSGRKKGKREKADTKRNLSRDLALLASSSSCSHSLSLSNSENESRESVETILMTFDALRRRLLQLDDVADVTKRPDMRAGAIMLANDLKANKSKRVGTVPGVEIGDIYYFRFEMCIVGLHSPVMGGIDYTKTGETRDEIVAISIVSAGGYENDEDSVDELVYTGQGGNSRGDKGKHDQKLERGNLALERSSIEKNVIRVIRSAKDPNCPANKIYIYDGLYKVQASWTEKAKSGFNVFKYKLVREPEQSEGISVWKMMEKWKADPSSRGTSVLIPDLSYGLESFPVCVVNEIDNETGPDNFTYTTEIKYSKKLSKMKALKGGCERCGTVCLPGDAGCYCSKQNGGYLPYSSFGVLVKRLPIIYECSPDCSCSSNCRNRVTQKGAKLHFEVFRTAGCGWGLCSWDPIRAGAFICEYTGKVVEKIEKKNKKEKQGIDEYLFLAKNPGEKALRWNRGGELVGDPNSDLSPECFYKPFSIVINARETGNVSRFMNHSCSPNVFWQPVQYDHGDDENPHIMFFAIKHIPPMTELTYDYGINTETEAGSSVLIRESKECLCGSPNCRGFFG